MKRLGVVLAIAGLALAIVLFVRGDVGSIVALVVAAGPGLVLAALAHILPMIANAEAWRRLLPGRERPGLQVLTLATWVRESVNSLLPVARIGGEIASYRIIRHHVARRSDVAASLIADMTISVLSQASFALFGLALLLGIGQMSTAFTQLLVGVAGMLVLGSGFLFAQRKGVLGGAMRALDGVFAGRLGFARAHSLRLDQALRLVYARHRDLASCFAWQTVGWMLGATEIWLALYFLGVKHGVLDAIVIEALIQAVSSAAFVVPGALGVQESAFVLVGSALGIDATTALALATARRLRDAIIFFPGLIVWQRTESRGRLGKPRGAAQSH
jgi:glycosyltransferase 2 family protein